jgi:hypothetical protein
VVKLPLIGSEDGHVQALSGGTPGRPPALWRSAWETVAGGVVGYDGVAHNPRFCSRASRWSFTNISWCVTFGGTIITWA